MTRILCVFIYVFIFLSFANQVFGQSREAKISLADSILNSRGEVYFSFSKTQFRPDIDDFVSVHKFTDSLVYAYANKKGFYEFVKLNLDFNLQKTLFSEKLKKASVYHFDSIYPSYPHYLGIMEGFKNQFNNYCELHEAGLSVLGRKLLMLKIAAPSHQTERPVVFLSSTIHGNELTGYKLLLWLTEYLLNNYGKDALVTKLMNETEIWINPLSNPDGTFFGGDNTVLEATRYNANQIDLNRNFPDPEKGEHPDFVEWQPETKAIMNFLKKKNIVLSAGLHTGDEVVNYPWDTWSKLHADHDWYESISRRYADMVHEQNSMYMTNFDNGIVNGFSWYRIRGGKQDYLNYYLLGREITIELSNDYVLDLPELENVWNYNKKALLNYIEQSTFGLTGKVTDSKNNPIPAKVQIINHDKDNSWVYSNSTAGVYYRYLSAGSYNVQFTAVGFNPVVKENVVINDGTRTTLDVIMEPNEHIYVFPNPFVDYLEIQSAKFVSQKFIDIKITGITGKVLFKKHIVNNSEKTIRINLPVLPQGTYILSIKASAFDKNFKLIRK